MKGSVGTSTIIEHRSQKKKNMSHTCQRCKHFSLGYCTQIKMKPSTAYLGISCKYYESRHRKKKK